MSSLRNAAAVLRCFSAAACEVSVTGVAARLSMPKSTVSRLLRTMSEAGLLELVADSRRYRPGVLLFEVGRNFRAGSDLIERLSEMAAVIVERCGHTGYVSVRDGIDILAVRMRPGRHMTRVVTPVGRRLPAFATAVGRALLARLSDAEVRALYRGRLDPPSPSAPQNVAELLQRLSRVRRECIAAAEDEANRGAGTQAVALVDPETGEAAAACISYSLSITSDEDRTTIRHMLLAGAARIGGEIGDPFWSEPARPAAHPPPKAGQHRKNGG